MTSSINTLIGTFSSLDVNSNTIIDSSNLICIDTSNNRIGINTINPACSIHIMNTTNIIRDITNAISTPKLFITEISNINIVGQTMASQTTCRPSEVYCDSSGYLRLRL